MVRFLLGALCLLQQPLRHVAQAGGTGCGRDYIQQITAMVRASGTPLGREDEAFRVQLRTQRDSCTSVKGGMVAVQMDLLGFASRGAQSGDTDLIRSTMRELYDLFEAHLTPEDVDEVHEGMALCVPVSCYGAMDIIPRLALTYFTCAIGTCSIEDLHAPVWTQDINASFELAMLEPDAGQGDVSGEAPSEKEAPTFVGVGEDDSAESTACVDDASASLVGHGSHYGIGLVPAYLCFQFDEEIRRLVIPNVLECRRLGGRMLLLRMDISAYIARGRGPEKRYFSDDALHSFRKLAEFFETGDPYDENMVLAFAQGFGICLPPSCMILAARSGLPAVALSLIVGSAGLTSTDAMQLPEPRMGTELNISGWAHAIQSGRLTSLCLPAEESILRSVLEEGWEEVHGDTDPDWGFFGGGVQEIQALGDNASAVSRITLLHGTGFELPSWYSCDAPPVRAEWQVFAKMVREAFVDGPKHELPNVTWDLLRAADKMIEEDWPLANEFADWVAQKSRTTCKQDYVHFDEISLRIAEDFTPFQYMLTKRDPRWKSIPDWQKFGAFCPYGYVVALYLRATALHSAGIKVSAVTDLQLARRMIGFCNELDLLDVKIWGIRVLDVEMELFRLTFPAAEYNVTHLLAQSVASRTEFYGMKHVWPEPLSSWKALAFHSLQLNGLYRLWTRTLPVEGVPRLAMLVMPPYLCLFLIPMLQRIWGADLDLSLFYIGRWDMSEKCSSCMEDYRQRYLVETPYWQELPLKKDTKSSTWWIEWSERNITLGVPGFLYHDFNLRFRDFLDYQPQARRSEVLLCVSPIWICGTMRMLAAKPVLVLDLPDFGLSGPPVGPVPPQPFGRLFAKDLVAGPPLRGVFVREDMMRGYHGVDKNEFGIAWPFVGLLSLYVSARYSCREDNRVLVMRAGSLYRFAPTIRGRLMFATLLQFETQTSPWHFRLLHESAERLSYEQLADHRAAIWVPLNMASKMTFKDLQIMEIPIFVPAHSLQASISARQVGKSCKDIALFGPAWAYIQCREVYISQWLAVSPAFRYPHLLHFESVTDLMLQLQSHPCSSLAAISAAMRTWNEALIAEDTRFWKDSILALMAWHKQEHFATLVPSAGGIDELGAAPFVVAAAAPIPYRMPEGLPRTLDWSKPWDFHPRAYALNSSCPEPLGAFCDFTQKAGRYQCCTDAHHARHGPIYGNISNPGPGYGEDCFTNISKCSEETLRFGLYSQQELPELSPDLAFRF